MQCTKHQNQNEKLLAMPDRNAIKGRAESLPGWHKQPETDDATMPSSKNQLCDMHRARRRVRILGTALGGAALVGVVVLVVYLTYRPVKPQASVSRAAVYRLESVGSAGNFSSSVGGQEVPPYALAANVQFTLLLHNPSDRASVLYDGLLAYVTYRGEMAAPPVELPAVAQDRGADVVLSPMFGLGSGAAPVPVSEETVRALEGDCAARRVLLRLVVIGRVRYKCGAFRTGWRDLFMRCDVTAGLGLGAGAGAAPLLEYPQCFVDA